METIWKFPIHLTDEQEVTMPKNAVVLAVQYQEGAITLWAKVDSDEADEHRRVSIRGTGGRLGSEAGPYIGTVQRGQYVWHVFA